MTETEESVREHEKRLADKQAKLAEAQRIERLAAYERDLDRQRDAGRRVADAAGALLEELEAYDNETLALRKLVEEMRTAFGSDERVAEVEAALAHEPEELGRSWEALVAAVKWRIAARAEPEDVDAETATWAQEAELSEELQGLAEERRRSRIMEYFNK